MKSQIEEALRQDPIIQEIDASEFAIKKSNRDSLRAFSAVSYEGKIILTSTDGKIDLIFKDNRDETVELNLLRNYLSPATIQKINNIVPDLIPELSRPTKPLYTHV